VGVGLSGPDRLPHKWGAQLTITHVWIGVEHPLVRQTIRPRDKPTPTHVSLFHSRSIRADPEPSRSAIIRYTPLGGSGSQVGFSRVENPALVKKHNGLKWHGLQFYPWHTKTSPALCCHFLKSVCVWHDMLIESDDRGEWSSCTSEERSRVKIFVRAGGNSRRDVSIYTSEC